MFIGLSCQRIVSSFGVFGLALCCHSGSSFLVYSLIIRWQVSVLNGVFHIRGRN